ncbi:TonB-dependent receptor [Coprobacter sp.]
MYDIRICNYALLCGIILSGIVLPFCAWGQTADIDTAKIYQLKEVILTGRTTNREVIPAQTLSGKQLERLSVHSVADAIRYFSGVQIKDYGGIGGLKTINIRSMGTNHVGVFYDGIELGNAQNGTIDLGRFSLDNMEAVTLYNGQKSNIFQPAKDYGSAGSVYLQSRTPRFETGENYHLKATFKTGSFGTANPSVLWEQKLSDNISGAISAEYMYTTGRYKFSYRKEGGYDTTAVRHNGDVNALRIETGLFGKIKNGNWRTKLYFYNSERGYPGAIVRNKFSNEDRQWDSNFFAQSSFRKSFTERYHLLISGKYAYDYLHYLADPRKDASVTYTDNHYRQQEIYLSAAQMYSIFSCWNISLSTDFQGNILNADLNNFAYPRRYSGLVAIATSFEMEPVKLQASLLGTFTKETTSSVAPAASHKPQYTPTVIASYRPWKHLGLDIRAFYKKIFRMPTLNDLYYTFIGNVKLNPEYTTQYDLGIVYTQNFNHGILRMFEIQADGYYNQVRDKIVAIPTSNFFRWTMVNLGKVRIKGIDIAASAGWQIGAHWLIDTRISYTYQKAQDYTSPDDRYYKDQIPYVPLHNGSAVVNAEYKSWELNYSFIYTGERYASRANTDENYILPWYTSDLSLSKNFRWNKTGIKATAEVNNLFNQQYEVVRSYPMPGTNFKLILNVTF